MTLATIYSTSAVSRGLFLFFGFGLQGPSIARHIAGTDGHLKLPPDKDNPLVQLSPPIASRSLYKIAHSEFGDGAEPNAAVFVRHLRNRTGALSPRNKNGALRQFVSKAGSATPELAFLATAPPPAAHPVGRSQSPEWDCRADTNQVLRATAPRIAFRPADRTDNPKHREQLLKLAYEWAQAAALRASLAIDAAEDGTPALIHIAAQREFRRDIPQ